jgi:hypothetical protein
MSAKHEFIEVGRRRAAIREKTNVSRVAEELLRGWLSGTSTLRR